MTRVSLVDVTTYYLGMLDPRQLRPRAGGYGWIASLAPREIAVNRDFYRRVGAEWVWIERLSWSDERWRAYVNRPGLETWIAHLDDEPVGYFELDDQPSIGVEIAYFGLLPAFIGRGLGGVLLTEAITRAWQRTPARVWVHTCTLDHPQALANYLARGFEIYKTETHQQSIG
jgi:GNAT superfamily N-acetyltransferase